MTNKWRFLLVLLLIGGVAAFGLSLVSVGGDEDVGAVTRLDVPAVNMEAYEQAITESMCLLAIVSDESLRSPHVRRAIQHFQAREKHMLLLQYEDIERMPMTIAKVPAITFHPDDPKRSFRLILAELRKLMMYP